MKPQVAFFRGINVGGHRILPMKDLRSVLAGLESIPDNPDLKKLESLRAPDEKFELLGTVFYLYAPSRNWRSDIAVMTMALSPTE